MLFQIVAYTINKKKYKKKVKIKKSYKNTRFKILAPTWNEEFELPDGSISDSPNDFEYILRKHGEKTVNLSLRIYIDKIENRIMFKSKAAYYLQDLTPERMKLLGSTKSKVTKNENGENVPNLQITEVVLVH